MIHYDFSRLRRLRGHLKLTQVQLSQRSGVSQRLISDLETGGTKKPSYDVVRAMSDAMGLTTDELAG